MDTNFIISCLMRNIDFISQLGEKGFSKIVVPKEVIEELKDLRFGNKTSREEREAIDIALELLQRKGIKKISLGRGRVDDSLIKKGKEGVFIATLDNGIRRQIPKKISISSAKKEVVIE